MTTRAFSAKRAYMGEEVAKRLGTAGGFASETHVVVALWSSEVLRTVRLRQSTFRSVCPDAPDAFAAWWQGRPPTTGSASCLVILDPLPGQRRSRRRWVGLDAVHVVDTRYRGYADALEALRRSSLA